MKQCHISILSVLVAFGVSGCIGSSSSVVNNSPSASSSAPSGASGAENISAKGIFSNLSELSYTPAGEGTYRIAPNDLVEINVFRVAELSNIRRRASQDGRISLPLVGAVRVVGQSTQQVERQLASKLSKNFLQNPQVSVFVSEQTSKEVTVGGRVKRAGVFPLKSATTVSQAVAMAGGLAELADPTKVVLFRPKKNGQFKAYHIDLKAIREGNKRDPYITGKDQLMVHESGSRVWLGRVLNVTRGLISPFSF